MKHPGPWTYELDPGDNCVSDANGDAVIVDAMGIQSDEARRLILAAPELLETLKACPVRAMDGTLCAVADPYVSMYETFAKWESDVCALIARIEGE